MRWIVLTLLLGSCGHNHYTVQERPTKLTTAEAVETLIGLGFTIDQAGNETLATTWEIYNVRPRNELVLRVVVRNGVAKGQCAERKNVVRGSTINRPKRFNESHWMFRPCTHRAGLARVTSALDALEGWRK